MGVHHRPFCHLMMDDLGGVVVAAVVPSLVNAVRTRVWRVRFPIDT